MLKFCKNDKYKTIAVYAFLTVCAAIVTFSLFWNFNTVWGYIKDFFRLISPITYGFIIAYLCNPLMKFFEKYVFAFKKAKKSHDKLRRALSVTLSLIVLLLVIALFFILLIPQVVQSYLELQENVNDYLVAAQALADSFVREFPLFNGQYDNLSDFLDVNEISTDLKGIITNSYNYIKIAADYVISYAGKFVIEIKNLIMGFILSVYFLLKKESLTAQIKKMTAAFFSRRHYLNLVRLSRYTHEAFGGFITGKLLDSLIIGLLSFVVLGIFKMPFYPLISVVIGITNIIPFFGPFIGAIPSAFIIFIADPSKTLWFVLIILVIQQLDGNVIGPRILGDSTGLSGLWIIISITIAGGLFGLPGMLLGVPAFAVIYTLFKQYVEKRLKRKKAPVGTLFYADDPPRDKLSSDSIFLDDDAEIADYSQLVIPDTQIDADGAKEADGSKPKE